MKTPTTASLGPDPTTQPIPTRGPHLAVELDCRFGAVAVLAEAATLGRVQGASQSFSEFMESALYGPDGFYQRAGQAGGRRGDFITSVETGPLFAALVGEWLDRRWRQAGCPEPFRVAEAGAGVGTLWRGLHRAQPDCFGALAYTLVERSERLRQTHAELPGSTASAAELPGAPARAAGRFHAVIANELLDNLVFDIAERTPAGWVEVRVGRSGRDPSEPGDFATSGGLSGAGGPALVVDPDRRVDPAPPAPDAPVGARVPIPVGAIDWLSRARGLADHVLVFDYGAPSAELADRGQAGWLRTYAGHERGRDPLVDPGSRDITHDVPFDQLPVPKSQHTQQEWLAEHGLERRLAEARDTWRERAEIGDLQAMFARSALNEAAALSDPTGLGGFVVMEW